MNLRRVMQWWEPSAATCKTFPHRSTWLPTGQSSSPLPKEEEEEEEEGIFIYGHHSFAVQNGVSIWLAVLEIKPDEKDDDDMKAKVRWRRTKRWPWLTTCEILLFTVTYINIYIHNYTEAFAGVYCCVYDFRLYHQGSSLIAVFV